jgi:hypothetical protein
MRTGGKILSDLADNTSHDVKPADIVSKRFPESAQNVIGKVLRGRTSSRKKRAPPKKKPRFSNRRDIFSSYEVSR